MKGIYLFFLLSRLCGELSLGKIPLRCWTFFQKKKKLKKNWPVMMVMEGNNKGNVKRRVVRWSDPGMKVRQMGTQCLTPHLTHCRTFCLCVSSFLLDSTLSPTQWNPLRSYNGWADFPPHSYFPPNPSVGHMTQPGPSENTRGWWCSLVLQVGGYRGILLLGEHLPVNGAKQRCGKELWWHSFCTCWCFLLFLFFS